MKKLLLMSIVLGKLPSCIGTEESRYTYHLQTRVSTEIYKKGWIDFNKNEREGCVVRPMGFHRCAYRRRCWDSSAGREDLPDGDAVRLQTGAEGRPPTEEWKTQLWKDGIEPSTNI